MERSCEIFKYLNVAQNKLGDVAGALKSVENGMLVEPNDPNFINNKKLYVEFLARQKIVEQTNILKENGTIAQVAVEQIAAIINNQPVPHILMPTLVSSPINDVQEENEEEIIIQPKENALDVVFFAGDGVECWNPKTIKKTGIGGSELMLMEQAKRLAMLGHKVRVYNSCGADGAKTYDGVVYAQTHEYHDLQCDVLIVSRRADMLDDKYNIQAKLRLLWVHDVCAVAATNALLLKADRILALSEWHKQNIINVHNVHPNHVLTTRNGIDLKRFNKQLKRDRFKCVNSSSPDRSWPILLDCWPRIKEQVPEATLHLYYGFKNWEAMAQHDKGQMDLIAYLKNKIREMESLGVVYHDRINQKQLAEEFLGAGCWVHPTWFTESSCITAMEMQAAGARMITSSIAALNETAGSRATLIGGEWTSVEYKEKFIQSVVAALKNEDNTDRVELQKYAKEHFGLDELAVDWEKMFYGLIDDKKVNPVVPYNPTTPYKKGGRGYYDGDPRFNNHNRLVQ